MKTNNLTNEVIVGAGIVTALVASVATVAEVSLTGIAVGVSYFAVAVMLALAAFDYRARARNSVTR